MKKYAFSLQKGGVGKTSLSGTIGFMLSDKGKKTVLVDCDPQGNLSSWYLTDQVDHELAGVLTGKVGIAESIKQIRENLFIIPTYGIDGELKAYGENQLANEPFIFEDLCNELEKMGFDYALFDLSPGMGRIERMVILAMDEVITPMTPEYFSLDGIEIFASELSKIRKNYKRENVQHRKIVCNGHNESIKQHREITGQLPQGYDNYIIPTDPAFRKAQSSHIALFELEPGDRPKKSTVDELTRLLEGM
ncbi:MAG: ParA family protein [Spirochaetia bacterium]|nr:ParA family protein [Spirochaetia bacterium]